MWFTSLFTAGSLRIWLNVSVEHRKWFEIRDVIFNVQQFQFVSIQRVLELDAVNDDKPLNSSLHEFIPTIDHFLMQFLFFCFYLYQNDISDVRCLTVF